MTTEQGLLRREVGRDAALRAKRFPGRGKSWSTPGGGAGAAGAVSSGGGGGGALWAPHFL